MANEKNNSSSFVSNHGTNLGQVKWFNHNRGFGFITNIDNIGENKDLFIHHSGIQTQGSVYKTLTQGEYVNYDEKLENGKLYAVNVTGVKGGKLLCEYKRTRSRVTNNKEE